MATIIAADLDPLETYIVVYVNGEWRALTIHAGTSVATMPLGSRSWFELLDRRQA